MRSFLVAAIAGVALVGGTALVSAQGGQNDIGLKASGNAGGPGGDVVVKHNYRSVEEAIRADARAQKTEDLSRNEMLKVVPETNPAPSGPAPGAPR
jgi:hypothetical protein